MQIPIGAGAANARHRHAKRLISRIGQSFLQGNQLVLRVVLRTQPRQVAQYMILDRLWGATNDNGIRLMHEHGFMTPSTIYVHAATLSDDSYHRIAATGGYASVSAESEHNAGQGYPPTWMLRRHNIPVSLSMDTSVWWSADLFSAMRATLNADRSREHMEAHKRDETVMLSHLRAEQVVTWATLGGAQALGMDSFIGSITPGKKADLVLIKNDQSPVMFPHCSTPMDTSYFKPDVEMCIQ